jgi:hypothetical protein
MILLMYTLVQWTTLAMPIVLISNLLQMQIIKTLVTGVRVKIIVCTFAVLRLQHCLDCTNAYLHRLTLRLSG